MSDRASGNNFLIDTGADVSVFPLPAAERGRLPLFFLQAANKTPIAAYGERSFALNLGLRRTFRGIFVLADVAHPIIGADFLDHFWFR